MPRSGCPRCSFLLTCSFSLHSSPPNYPSIHPQALRPASYILMGKNTMMRKCIRDYCERIGDDSWMTMAEKLIGNVGIVFTSGELGAVREKAGPCAAATASPQLASVRWWYASAYHCVLRDSSLSPEALYSYRAGCRTRVPLSP